jgi:hypothetical protein
MSETESLLKTTVGRYSRLPNMVMGCARQWITDGYMSTFVARTDSDTHRHCCAMLRWTLIIFGICQVGTFLCISETNYVIALLNLMWWNPGEQQIHLSTQTWVKPTLIIFGICQVRTFLCISETNYVMSSIEFDVVKFWWTANTP